MIDPFVKPLVSKLKNGNWKASYADKNGLIHNSEGGTVDEAIANWYKKYSKKFKISSG
mgnify:FL=1|tara:strand:- start:33 stop:206 length:174 start_codon:yes stop_codon:yes gene_type:complete